MLFQLTLFRVKFSVQQGIDVAMLSQQHDNVKKQKEYVYPPEAENF